MLLLDVSLCAQMIINDVEQLQLVNKSRSDELCPAAEYEEEEAVLWFRFGRT